MSDVFHSQPPTVTLTNFFSSPLGTAFAAARTCYSSKGIIQIENFSKQEDIEKRNKLLLDIYKAGHHTVFQHIYLQFAISNVSRHFIWSFLHSHPFYNSEQVSQRYVKIKNEEISRLCFIPPLPKPLLEQYIQTIQNQIKAYYLLSEMLIPIVESEYYKRFPKRKNNKKYSVEVSKKSQEFARYVLPISTFAYLYHTINALTLLRYYKLLCSFDTPLEQKYVVEKMVNELLKIEPDFSLFLSTPIPQEEIIEYQLATNIYNSGNTYTRKFIDEFDKELGEQKYSKLISFKPDNEKLVAQAVRSIIGIPENKLSDEEAINAILNPSKNTYLAQTLNLLTTSKLTRALYHAQYTFKKRLSHTADSQDQRHRTTPASRPVLMCTLDPEEPDYVTPEILKVDTKCLKLYQETITRTWEVFKKLSKGGAKREYAVYLLPNALTLRYIQSVDFLNLFHKLKLRLCYNAQEEIWHSSLEEAREIKKVNPILGNFLSAPCRLRFLANTTPYCPEGTRFCGLPIWQFTLSDYNRVI